MALSHLDALKIPSQDEHMAKALERIENLIVVLHPLLDLLNKSATEEEQGLVQRLIDLLTELKEELRLNREAAFDQQERFDRIEALLTDQNRMIREMHGLFTMETSAT
ncbi:hypothetical protein LGQ03_05935 [Loktanella sp. TSTF-M6]|uniref:Gas vesicle protein K n=1 Tax=Loktanella gaetbuli TaxID=2881335 RepID=A0ABS8BSR3_9RHOB|nr:hypothetical protein [Loktanella gaetbuli]MCB5198774.1 hypothetical protein [Loktanella gaetbuli]